MEQLSTANDMSAGEQPLNQLSLLIRLYEGAIRFLSEAASSCKEGEVENFKDKLSRGRRIIEEFQKTLDYKQGGQLTAQLNDLYDFMLNSLTQADLTHDPLYIERVILHLRTLLDGWQGAQRLTATQ
ncbi:flagellar export chaperone FliS [Magnetococcales bacterium HHB-1]